MQASYHEQEQLVWEGLAGLVRDAAWLKAYVAGALNAMREAMQVRMVCVCGVCLCMRICVW